MPPKGSKIGQRIERESSVEKTAEYEDFLKELAVYHEKRGTILDPEPKVGMRHIDLLKLYKRVVDEGGYDLVSDTKAKPLMWRKLAEEFIGKSPHLAAQAFMVKSAYYKNLVAYEISNHWGKEPPPKEIVEDLTAKGGAVMTRTLDSFHRPPTRDESLANANSSDNEEETRDNHDDEPGSVRSTRGLRHAPPQRVLFQPDTNPARQTRNQGQHGHTPASPSPALVNNTPMTLATYEPRQQIALTLKPVTTPANNPEHYRLKRKQQQEAQASQAAKRHKGLMLPGTGFIGPNIYVRAQLALQSGLPEEEEYALHHLVKISHERGDKYRFDQFAGLAEALINKMLQISSLFYDLEWLVSYQRSSDPRGLDAIDGTSDLLEKLQAAVPLDTDHDVETSEFRQALGRITEAGLVIRNMVMLDENAQYISKLPLLRDYFCIVLNLRPHAALVELQHYALETVEQLTKYYDLDSTDLLYETLLGQLQTSDRGRIVTSLRAISRLGMTFEENKRLELVPLDVVQKLPDWMMLPDEELRSACLDFLFQYTSIADNVETLVLDADVQTLVRQLSDLLLFNAKKEVPKPKPRPTEHHHDSESSAQVPRLSQDIIEQLLQFSEPDRSSRWLRMCFEHDPQSEMTQIHLWQSYQATFLQYTATHGNLIAGDFIKNVSNTFSGASAQVAGSNKYVIRGIKPRKVALDRHDKQLVQCHWRSNPHEVSRELAAIFANADGRECGEFFANGEKLFEHIVGSHLKIPRKPSAPANGDATQPSQSPPTRPAFDFANADPHRSYACEWSTCTRRPSEQSLPVGLALLARHINTHLPSSSTVAELKRQHHRDPQQAEDPASTAHVWHRTMSDERNDAAGLPLGSALVLRNIARGVRKMAPVEAAGTAAAEDKPAAVEEEEQHVDGVEDGVEIAVPKRPAPASAELMKKIFDPVREKVFFAMAHNPTLVQYLTAVIKAIAAGGG